MGSSPAVVVPEGGELKDALVYFSGFNGRLYCLYAKDMSLKWELDLRHADPEKNQPVTNTKGDIGESDWTTAGADIFACGRLVLTSGR